MLRVRNGLRKVVGIIVNVFLTFTKLPFQVLIGPTRAPSLSDTNIRDDAVIHKDTIFAERDDHFGYLAKNAEIALRDGIVDLGNAIQIRLPALVQFLFRTIA